MPGSHIGIVIAGVVVFLVSLAGVYAFGRYAVVRGHLDVPNDRSSHVKPTPRGGGLVIAIAVLVAYLTASAVFDFSISLGYLVGAVLVVAVSWLDDVYSVPFHWRLLIHIATAALLIADTGYIVNVYVPYAGASLDLGRLGALISVIGIVWVVNAYNFMDGIDGIAGVQGVTAALGWLLIAIHVGTPGPAFLAASLLAGCLGFLFHNWPPAKIFMGDAGSAFLGFTFAAMPFVSMTKETGNELLLPWIGVLLLWLFVFDSVVTVVRRIVRGERIWQAHRSHLYQRMVINGLSHRKVTTIYLFLSLAVMAATYASATSVSTIDKAAIPVAIASALLLVGAFLLSRWKVEQK